MELVHGVTLKSLTAGGPLPVLRAVTIGWAVADALAAAHRAGVVHRDVKPGNLMVSNEAPTVRVLDFGISKRLASTTRVTWTQTDGVLGTPAYMAPEQFDDPSGVTAASDIYSLGVVLFEMVTGSRPSATGPRPAAQRALAQAVTAPPAIPHIVVDIIDRCLSREPAQRPSALELSAELAAFIGDHTTRRIADHMKHASRLAEARA